MDSTEENPIIYETKISISSIYRRAIFWTLGLSAFFVLLLIFQKASFDTVFIGILVSIAFHAFIAFGETVKYNLFYRRKVIIYSDRIVVWQKRNSKINIREVKLEKLAYFRYDGAFHRGPIPIFTFLVEESTERPKYNNHFWLKLATTESDITSFLAFLKEVGVTVVRSK